LIKRTTLSACKQKLEKELNQLLSHIPAGVLSPTASERYSSVNEKGRQCTDFDEERKLEGKWGQKVEETWLALEKIKNGSYDGKCEVCGQNIPEPRLLAQPTATTCVGCKARNHHVDFSKIPLLAGDPGR
jgi:DnaK suppressor protein